MRPISIILFLFIIAYTEVVVDTYIFWDGLELVESMGGEDNSEKQSKKAGSDDYTNFIKLPSNGKNALHLKSLTSTTFSFEAIAMSQIIIEIPIPPPDGIV